ncbi:MAG: nitroreductase family protein [Oscillospiraceae bacterium]|nr:nitroreductase family protein [Oscillospiraceae bacterium]
MKQEALEVLKNRRSIRKFKQEQVSEADLNAVLEAGTYAPTAAGTQAPVIVAVQDANTVAQLDAMNAKVLTNEKAPHPYSGAQTNLLVLVPADGYVPDVDGALVGGNLLNAAYAVGLGACWIHRSKEMFESAEGKALLKKWGLPETMRGVSSIALGYPDCPQPSAAPRKADYIVRV